MLMLSSLALCVVLPAIDLAGGAETELALSTKVHRKWKFRLPAETWHKVGNGIRLAGSSERVFKAQLDGTSLALDVDGDGELDTKIAPEGGVVLLVADGRRTALRLRSQPAWSYAPASVQTCKIEGTKLRLIDQNNNGRFDDIGEDALIVGSGKSASFLSEVIHVRGQLLRIRVSPDGKTLRYSAYEGETSKVAIALASEGRLLAAVLKSTDGRYSFDLSRAKAGMSLPSASYVLQSGLLSLGGNTVRVRGAASKALALRAGESAELKLGAPVRVSFDFEREGGKCHFRPDAIFFHGRSGEEYFDWKPLGKSPKITIDDAVKNKRLAEVIFPPNC